MLRSALGCLVIVAAFALAACGDSGSADIDAGPTVPHALTRNDISVLLPLPPAGRDLLWPATTMGKGGALLPRATFDMLGETGFELSGDAYPSLRVVAVRFDPCFRTNWGGVPCQPQLRLVFQAVKVNDSRTTDGAVHALYNLSEEEFAALAVELRALTAASPQTADATLPLQPSLAIFAQGYDGAYAQGLLRLVTTYAGAANLVRLTAMARGVDDQNHPMWDFNGIAIIENQVTGFGPPGTLTIFGSQAIGQSVVDHATTTKIDYTVSPAFADARGQLGVSEAQVMAADATARQTLHTWALGIENPMQVVPDTTDCASCHLVGHVRRALELIDPTLADPAEVATRGKRIVNAADGDTSNLRAFGYLGDTPYVSQRTANETDYAVSLFATLFPAP